MKAIVYPKYGPPEVLEFREVGKPAPKENEVLVKVHAASVNAMDYRFLRGEAFAARLFAGLRRPRNKFLGADIAGRVEAVGRSAKQFQPGNEVFGGGRGSFAEYACVREDRLVLKPGDMPFEDAAAFPVAGLTALQALRDKGRIQPGQRVLIQGAGGGVGTFAVQIAKSFGAEVTAVCGPGNLDVVRSLGADHVFDYTQEDFTKNGQRYDLILAVNGYHSIFAYRRSLSPGGIYVVAGGSLAQIFQGLLLGPAVSIFGKKKLGGMLARIDQKDLGVLIELYRSGKVKPAIDRRYPLGEVAEAFRYLEEGHARGKVIITVEQSHPTGG